MKKCEYCGRENDQETSHCRECGTALPVSGAEPSATAAAPELNWLKCFAGVVRYLGLGLVIIMIYLLSFGPVDRYYRTTMPPTTMPRTTLVNGQQIVSQVTVVRVSYPRWVGFIYYPAFLARSASGGDGLYSRYLRWWEDRPAGK
jgi:hypothetical protein